VPGFKNHLIFYRVKGEALDVLAVLEAHRDLASVLEKR
jgi:plasmid stabilization system protein ParE